MQERDGFALLLVGMHGGEGDTCMVVDGHEQHLPACTIDQVTPVAGHAITGPDDASELLVSICSMSPGASCS
jgi:hypothetical protein